LPVPTSRDTHLLLWQQPAADILLLTWAAGMMDALSYLRAGVFTANMTGNTVVLGLAIAGIEKARTVPAAVSIGSFAAGALIAAMAIPRNARPWSRDLKLGTVMELPFAVAFALLWIATPAHRPYSLGLIVLAGMALGIQSVAVRRMRIWGVATTFITGTVTTAMMVLVSRSRPVAPRSAERSRHHLLLFLMLIIYVVAAATAAVLSSSHGVWAVVLPLGAILTVCLRSFFAAR
jgi:uncharacterized membrane protein YoaK (UPF0700 family)